MPSPFPGMDPYLEHPEIFPDFHDRLVTYLSDALQPYLPEPYYSAIGRRAWIEVSEPYIDPDVNVIQPRQEPGTSRSGTAVIDSPAIAQPLVIHVPHDERREPYR